LAIGSGEDREITSGVKPEKLRRVLLPHSARIFNFDDLGKTEF
jgi:hypothetical protein